MDAIYVRFFSEASLTLHFIGRNRQNIFKLRVGYLELGNIVPVLGHRVDQTENAIGSAHEIVGRGVAAITANGQMTAFN